MKNGEGTFQLQVVLAFLIIISTGQLSPVLAGKTLGQAGAPPPYPATSWAVGVVVPEGASLQGGEKVRWAGVNNVTAAVTLPNITLPDEIVYAVLSIMTSDGSVLQAAAGIRPGDGNWFAYAWMIPSATSVPLVYHWVLNASEPMMAPQASISISIYQTSGVWSLRVVDEQTGAIVGQPFPAGVGGSVRAGDQEVFALESYSRSGETFRTMGNLTLAGMFLDGSRVTGGVYAYADWDPVHTLLFAVGSAGATPPSFVSFGREADGSFVWGYAPVWRTPSSAQGAAEIVLVLVSVALGVVGVVLWKTRRVSAGLPNG